MQQARAPPLLLTLEGRLPVLVLFRMVKLQMIMLFLTLFSGYQRCRLLIRSWTLAAFNPSVAQRIISNTSQEEAV